MPSGDKLINAVKDLNEDGKLSPEVTNTLVLASLGDVLVVVREIKTTALISREHHYFG